MTRSKEISRNAAVTSDKRRSIRIANVLKPDQSKKHEIRNITQRKSIRQRNRPLVGKGDSFSDSSSSNEEEEYDIGKDVDLEENDFSDEIGEQFLENENDCVNRTRISSSSYSEKENRRVTRSHKLFNPCSTETPSKKLARDLEKASISSSSKIKLAKSNNLSTPAEQKNKVRERKTNIFQDDSESSSDESVRSIQDPINKKQRTPISIKIPAKMINPKITPLIISKTPGGTLRTRRRVRRDSNELVNVADPLDSSSARTLKELASRLHLSKVPEKLPCRDYESSQIEKFISEAIDPTTGESSAMYISGVPGTGKTATVRAVVNSMKKNPKCPKFVYVEVNAMIFKKTVFIEVYNGILKEYDISKKSQRSKIAATTARQELNSMFKKEDPKRPAIVFLVDELDSLCNRKQDVLYDIFEWTVLPQSRVTIIGIANTLDFPERTLSQRNASRLDKRRLVFQPYQHEQIEEIIRARLQGSHLVDPKAVELVAKKVAMNTGDLRQALDFLCRAIQVAVERKSEKLDLSHILAAQNAVLEPLKYRLVKGLRLHQLNLFRAIEAMTREQEEVIFANVYRDYCIICSEVSGIGPATDDFAYKMLLQLASSSLVILSKDDNGMMCRRIKLGMTSIEAEKAIKLAKEKHESIYSL